MSLYYFIISKNQKDGPYNFEQLKSMKLDSKTKVWRSDFEIWKDINEVEELIDLIYKTPPKTEREIKLEGFREKYKELIGIMIFVYLIYSFVITIISFQITQNSWNTFLQKLKKDNIDYERHINSGKSGDIILLSEILLFNRYPMYNRGIDLENIYGIQQGTFFRVYKPFFTTNYISRRERNEGTLFTNLLLSSYITNFIVFCILSFIIYFIKKPYE